MQYANKEAARIAARAAADFDYGTLDITVNLHGILENRETSKIILALESGKCFILYRDADCYCVVVPKAQMIEINGVQEQYSDPKGFLNRLKIAIATYPHYFEYAETNQMLLLQQDHSGNRIGDTAGRHCDQVPALRGKELDQGRY